MCIHSIIWPGSHIYGMLPCAGYYLHMVSGTKAWPLSLGMQNLVGWTRKYPDADSSAD